MMEDEKERWNYRVCKNKQGFDIREVYFTLPDTTPHSWAASPVYLAGETVNDIKKDLALIQKAFDRPVFEIPKDTTDD